MPFVMLICGVILLVTVYQDTTGALYSELLTDIPAFGKWAAAIVCVGALGFIPVLSTPAKLMLGLIFVGLVLSQNSNIPTIIANITASPTPPTPSAAAAPIGSLPITISQGTAAAGGGIIGAAASALGGGSSSSGGGTSQLVGSVPGSSVGTDLLTGGGLL